MMKEWLRERNDEGLLEILCWVFLAIGAVLVIMNTLNLQVPYGRYGDKRNWLSVLLLTGIKVPARMAWFIMEMPSFAIPLYLYFNVGGQYVGQVNPNVVLLGMFLLHYFNRVFIFSLSLKGKPVPIFSPLTACMFTSINGFIQGRYLIEYLAYSEWWFIDPRFLLGHFLFLLGMAGNIHSDSILRGLRKPGETGYKIPRGGLFDYVSGANYFSECLEWTGYAIACWSWPGVVFAIFTCMFLGSRSLQHHRFYLKKFEDYPKDRKAFIPFIL